MIQVFAVSVWTVLTVRARTCMEGNAIVLVQNQLTYSQIIHFALIAILVVWIAMAKPLTIVLNVWWIMNFQVQSAFLSVESVNISVMFALIATQIAIIALIQHTAINVSSQLWWYLTALANLQCANRLVRTAKALTQRALLVFPLTFCTKVHVMRIVQKERTPMRTAKYVRWYQVRFCIFP